MSYARRCLTCLDFRDAIGALAAGGCVTMPSERAEAPPLPSAWRDAPQGAEQPVTDWWQGFNDPALNQLVVEALSEGPSVQLAVSRVREARAIPHSFSALGSCGVVTPSITNDQNDWFPGHAAVIGQNRRFRNCLRGRNRMARFIDTQSPSPPPSELWQVPLPQEHRSGRCPPSEAPEVAFTAIVGTLASSATSRAS